MRVLKYVLYALTALVLIVVGVGLFGPKTYRVERSVDINADAGTIYQQISSFKNLNAWSPWNKYDTVSLKHTYEGVEGTVGAKTCWEGSDQVGSGCQTFSKLEENKRVDIDLAFVKPFESQAKTYLEITSSDNGQKVTWGMNGENNFISKIFGLFMNMDKMIGNDFDAGLADLKKICENAPKTPSYEIKEQAWETKTYIGIKKTMAFTDDFSAFLGSSYTTLMASKPEIIGAPVGLYFTWDEASQKTEMAAALPVSTPKVSKEYEVFEVKANKAFVIDYYGAYDKSMAAHQAMDVYLKEKGLTQKSPVIEEYITDPMTEKDTTKWLTKIYYLAD